MGLLFRVVLSIGVLAGIGVIMCVQSVRAADGGGGGLEAVRYLALGDSYSSGEGELDDAWYIDGTNSGANRCHVSGRSYPYLLGREWGLVTRNMSCSGSRIPEVRQVSSQYAAIPNFPWLPVVSVGVGGNDVDLMGKLKTCLGLGTCEWATPNYRSATAGEIRALFPKLTALITELQESLKPGILFVVGYPRVINDAPDAACSLVVGGLLNAQERRYMNESVSYINKILRTASNSTHAHYMDIEDVYRGERLCDASERAMNGIRYGDDIAPIPLLRDLKLLGAESFHPTPRGHELAAAAVATQMVPNWADQHCATRCEYNPSQLDAGDYWTEETSTSGPTPKLQANSFLQLDSFQDISKKTTRIAFQFLPGTFTPFSRVRLEVHSDPQLLGEFMTENDGSLRGDIASEEAFGSVPTGYHTVHAYGVSAVGEAVDLYETIYVDAPPGDAPHVVMTATSTTELRASPKQGTTQPPGSSRGGGGTLPQVLGSAVTPGEQFTQADATNAPGAHATLPAPFSAAPHTTSRAVWAGVILLGLLLLGIMADMSIRKVVKRVIPTKVFSLIEPTGHLVEAMYSAFRYGFPARKMRVIGVTGTNGKTTTTFFIQKMLHEAGIKAALTSTVAYGVGNDIEQQVEHATTAKASILQRRLKDFAAQGVEWVVIETSSHALAQHRVWGIPYEVAVFTNLTHDHLEYHKTFENYREAKRRLFKIANTHGMRFGVVNAEDPSAEAFTRSVANSTTYGISRGDITASNIQLGSEGSTYTAHVGDDSYHIAIHLPGEFNISNSLAALAVGRKLGLTKEQIERGLAALQSVEGRMNAIDEGQPFKVVIDFASTPDGFEKFFSAIRPLVKGKLIAVFGSAGRRDESKRAEQGRIAGQYADVIIATEEDDRDEDGAAILAQIAEGALETGKVKDETLFLVPNREEAIGLALTKASTVDDMVVLLGKGHEKTIERNDGEYPWSESEVTRAALRALQGKE